MTISLLGSLSGTLLGWLMGSLSLFLIMLILIQRGKGGGLTGALGGPGGQSAFGSKAGDTFTVITIVVASVWGFTCAFTMWLLGTHTPTTITETNISAGPGDEADAATGNELIIPPAGSGFGGLGGLSVGDDAADTPDSETPSVDLTPATPPSETTETESTKADPETTDSAKPVAADSPEPDSSTPSSAEADSEAELETESDEN